MQRAGKDRALAAYLIGVLAEEDPYAISDAWATARAKGAAWCTRLNFQEIQA